MGAVNTAAQPAASSSRTNETTPPARQTSDWLIPRSMTAGPEPREHAPSSPRFRRRDQGGGRATPARARRAARPAARRPVDRDQGPGDRPPPRSGGAAHRLGEIRGLLRRHGAAARPGRGTDGDRIATTRAHAQPDRGRPDSRHQRPDHQLGQHRGMGRGPRRDRSRHGRRAAGQPRAAEQPRLPRPHPPPARRIGRHAGHRRGALHLRLGARLPARLPPPALGGRRPHAGRAGARDHRDRQRQGHPRRRGATRLRLARAG